MNRLLQVLAVTVALAALTGWRGDSPAMAVLAPPTLLTRIAQQGIETPDGRFLLFNSDREDLVAGDTNDQDDVFVQDLAAGTIEIVSVTASGLQGDRASYGVSISDDGRFVSFMSEASTLVASDGNGWTDVFVKDLLTGDLELISVNMLGGVGNLRSEGGYISPDGRYVAFNSEANDLVPNDTSICLGSSLCYDSFVYDRELHVMDRVSVSTFGVQANQGTWVMDMSPDARFVLFHSIASNLDPADQTTFPPDLFVRDRETNETELVSIGDYSGVQGYDNIANISSDGRFVVFDSQREMLFSESEDYSDTIADIYIRDLTTNSTSRLLSPDGTPINGDSHYATMSDSGRFISFLTKATNLVPGSTGEFDQVVVLDRDTGVYAFLSRNAAGDLANGASFVPEISRGASVVTLRSNADNLVPGESGISVPRYRVEICSVSTDDGDCVPDWFESTHSCLSSMANDTGDADSDGVDTLDEFVGADLVRFSGDETEPCQNDSDGDGFADLHPDAHTGPANASPALDNCPLVANPDQSNHDGDFADLTPPLAYNDQTVPISDALGDACDADDDNDGLSDVDEASTCPASSGPTDVTLLDTDDDLFRDYVECWTSDAADPNSRPPDGYCSDSTDGDGDGVTAGKEWCYFGTDYDNPDSDGDGCPDGREIASVNADRKVNAIDLSQVAQHFDPGYTLPAPAWVVNFDVNRDTKISSIDLSQVAQRFGDC